MKKFLKGPWRKFLCVFRKYVNIDALLRKRLIIVDGPIRYSANGVYTKHNADFNSSGGKFVSAYEESCNMTGFAHPAPWRIYVCCWAIKKAVLEKDGDLVECGVWKGTTSYAGMLYSDWNNKHRGKQFWLVDSWEGIDNENLIDGEDEQYARSKEEKYKGVFPGVSKLFGDIDGVKLMKGFVPDVLKNITSNRISYLHIDMNSAYPEVETLKYFWERLVPGAIVVLDDYGFSSHEMQKKVIDEFCAEIGSEVLTLPTGQGLITK